MSLLYPHDSSWISKEVNPLYQVRLYWVTGIPAFSDNSILQELNRTIGREQFPPRTVQLLQPTPVAPSIVIEAAKQRPARDVFVQSTQEGRVKVLIYKTRINLPRCTVCHGSNHTIRGMAEISTDITDSIVQQQESLLKAVDLFLGSLVVLSFSLGRFFHRQIISPMKEIGIVCSQVTEGNFNVRAAAEKNDEIGELANTANRMAKGPKERIPRSRNGDAGCTTCIPSVHRSSRKSSILP